MENLLSYLPMVLLALIPLVVILTAHQRRMARIVMERETRGRETDGLRNEVMHLQQVVRSQAVMIEDLKGRLVKVESYNEDVEHGVCA